MAEETDHTLECQKLSGGVEDNSLGNTAGKLHVPNKRDSDVPHYLRASTGSCHDACKYGKPYEFKVKPWRPMRRVSAPSPDSEKTEEIQIFADKKVNLALQADKLAPSITQDVPPPADGLKKKVPSSRKSSETHSSELIKQEARPFRKSPSASRTFPEPHSLELIKHEARTYRKSPSPSRKSPEPHSSEPIKREARPFRKSPSPEVSKAMKKVVGPPGKPSSPDTLKSINREVTPAAKRDVSAKRSSSNVKERNTSAGPTKSSGSAVKLSYADSSVGSDGKRNTKTTSVGDLRSSRASVKKGMGAPAAVISSQKVSKMEVKRTLNSSVTGPSRTSPGVKAASSNLRKNKSPKDQTQRSRASPKNQVVTNNAESKEPADEKVEERTLHMIETRDNCLSLSAYQNGSHFIQSPSPLSPESLNSSSQENSHSFTSQKLDDEQDLGSDYTSSEADDSAVGSLKEEKGQVGHAKTLDSGDRDPSTMKLKFRRGKIISPQPDTNSPTRLRFRPGKNLGDNQGLDSPQRRSYRRRATDGEKKQPEPSPVKVVLKHQEVEEKKDMQVLLNNVIEETASKLVQTRKSKVKALVGAFETVISLQESKPSILHAANR